jgi:subfamily B ATP-binding cassette protein MsbA
MFIIIFFSILAGFLESIGISLLLPVFQSLITNKEEIILPSFFNKFFSTFNIEPKLANFIVFFLLLFLLKAIVKFFTGYLKVYYSGKFLLDLRVNLINKLINYNFISFTRKDTGKISTLLTMEVEKLLSGFIYFSNYLVTIFTGFSFVIVVFYMNYKFALVIILFGVLYYSLFRNVNKSIKVLSKEITDNNSNFNSLLIQFIQSYKYLKSTNNFSEISKLLKKNIIQIRKKHLQKDLRTNIIVSIQEPLTLLILVLLVYFSMRIIKIDASTSILIILLFYRSTSYFLSSQNIWNTFLSQIGSTNSVINFENELKENGETHSGINKIKFHKSIIIKNLSFSFNNKTNTLDNINLELKYKTTTAIVGKSGSGKSTLINMITGLIQPNKGDIFIDETSINDVDISYWRSKIGFITQESVIFNDSILNNITLWNYDEKKNKEWLLNVIKMSRLDDFIISDDELLRVVGDRGISLSGGQRQRISIARELYKKPQVLILDEATSALDSETENYINKSIESLKGSVTLIVIAHRLSTIKNADNIYVIEDGKSIENGSYQELSDNPNSKFSSLIKFQSL